MKVDKKALRRMILREMRNLPSAGHHAQKGSLRRGSELSNPHVDYSRLAEQDGDTLADDLADATADLAAAGGALQDIEDNAMVAIRAIVDIAGAAGVELNIELEGADAVDIDVEEEEVEVDDDGDVDVDVESSDEEVLQQESRRRAYARRALLRRIDKELRRK